MRFLENRSIHLSFVQNNGERKTTMSTQDNATTIRSLYDLFNTHQSNSDWLDKGAASYAENCEIVNVPFGMALRGPDAYKQFVLGFATAFPDSTTEVTNVIVTEDSAVVEL